MNACRTVGGIAVCLSTLISGCQGFTPKPMPNRLGEEQQILQDYGWAHLLLLGDEVDRQALMDAVLMKQLWHQGVDSLHMVSERQVDDVLIVMESHFDRTNPEGDEFLVTFYDASGAAFRQESYSADELDAAVALYMRAFGALSTQSELSSEELERQELARKELKARQARVQELFPEPEIEEADGDGLEPDAEGASLGREAP